VRRWYLQAQIDGGHCRATSEERWRSGAGKPRFGSLRRTSPILRVAGPRCSSRARPLRSLIVAFVDECCQASHAVESICRVLIEQGCPIAARIYQAWSCEQQQAATRTLTDAGVMDKVLGLDGRRRG
jgi:hypothetical protein